jgi:hypothetical protein
MLFIKLYYAGILADPQTADELALEVEQICKINNWKHLVWEEDWSKLTKLHHNTEGLSDFEEHAPLRGITFNPHPDCETIWLTFTPDGMMNSIMTLQDPNFTREDASGLSWNRVKMGFDGAITHIKICKLFHFLEKKYFKTFEIHDQTGFWIDNDEARCIDWFEKEETLSEIMNAEIQRIYGDDSIPKEEKRVRFLELQTKFGLHRD